MQSIPVTDILIGILKDALTDSFSFISTIETDLETKPLPPNIKDICIQGIEVRKQNIAVIKSILERYAE